MPRAQAQLRAVLRRMLPAPARRWVAAAIRRLPGRRLRFGDLRRLTPINPGPRDARGRSIDAHYADEFVSGHADDVAGDVLHIGDSSRRPVVDDLRRLASTPTGSVDCVVCLQALAVAVDLPAAAADLHRVLRPGGVALIAVPGVAQVADKGAGAGWEQTFTRRLARTVLEGAFGPENVGVDCRGNVLAAVARLHGLGADELAPTELAHRDPDYEVLVTARAVRKA